MQSLRKNVLAVLHDSFNDALPHDVHAATAFGMFLTWKLRPATAVNPILYGQPKPKPKKLVESQRLHYVHKEILVNFTVVEQESSTKRICHVGCESEMFDRHGTGYSLDACENGYTFDFWKLLMFQAPILLFAARVAPAYSRTFSMRLDTLQESLLACAKDYHEYWSRRRLYTVLLPSEPKERHQVRLGVGRKDGGIAFGRL